MQYVVTTQQLKNYNNNKKTNAVITKSKQNETKQAKSLAIAK